MPLRGSVMKFAKIRNNYNNVHKQNFIEMHKSNIQFTFIHKKIIASCMEFFSSQTALILFH